MVNFTEIAELALNLSLYFYLLHYIPQVWHNRNKTYLQEMSLWFHGLLLLCYSTDLIYAFAYAMPWQYQCVSLVGTVCLGYQQYQISRLFEAPYWVACFNLLLLSGLIIALALVHFISIDKSTLIKIEYVSQISAFIYMVPQLIRNLRLKSANGLSGYFLLLNLGCILTDNIAAWGLNWPLPNKLGAGFRLFFIVLLIAQFIYYHSRRRSILFAA